MAIVIEFALGLVLVGLTLQDVFDTVVVPGESRARLQVARRLLFISLPVVRWGGSRDRTIPTWFAPSVLVTTFVSWMLLLVLGFGLLAHSLHDAFEPALPSFSQALYVAGSALVTVGLSETDATGLSRWVTLGAGFCGLGVMTMAVTYLLQVQSGVSRRDAGILKLTTSSGEPPSAVGLLERYAELGSQDELERALLHGRDWCAEMLQSHASHPSLIYFRSVGTGSGWPATLGTLMDLAVLLETSVDVPALSGQAALLREQGTRLAEALALVLQLEIRPVPTSHADAGEAIARLRGAGYSMRAEAEPERLAALRAKSAPLVAALADHLGTARPPLLPGANA